MSQAIKRLYENAGFKPPKGKGIHKYNFHEIAVNAKTDHPDWSWGRCYKYAMGGLGRNRAVKRSHWAGDYKPRRKSKIHQMVDRIAS